MASNNEHNPWLYLAVLCTLLYLVSGRTKNGQGADESSGMVPQQQGNLAHRGGSPTIRRPYRRSADDPSTTNDETNDQPIGHFGTLTLSVCYVSSGNCYDVDAELSGTTLERLYFPKGGWVDMDNCELDEDLTGSCDDEKGRSWEINGES